MVLIGKYPICTHEKTNICWHHKASTGLYILLQTRLKGIYALGVHTVKNFFHT